MHVSKINSLYNVKISIYNESGKFDKSDIIKNARIGINNYIWNASGFSTGNYFAVITAGNNSKSQVIKLQLLK